MSKSHPFRVTNRAGTYAGPTLAAARAAADAGEVARAHAAIIAHVIPQV